VEISRVNYGTSKYNRYRYTITSLTNNLQDIGEETLFQYGSSH